MIEGIKRGFQKYMGITVVILIAIVFYKIIDATDFPAVFGWVFSLLKPFITGFLIAYILNPIVGFFRSKVFGRIKPLQNKEGLVKTLSIIVTYLLVVLLVYFMIVSIIPEIISSIQRVVSVLLNYLPTAERQLNAFLENYNMGSSYAAEIQKSLSSTIDSAFGAALDSLKNVPTVMSTIMKGTFNVASWLLNFVIGVIISLYFLVDKKNLIRFGKKVFYALLPQRGYNVLADFVKDANRTFESFFIGKVIDSLIIGVIFFFGCCFISPDYALLFACVIGITNIIPYFGPFIGSVPVVALCLMQNPISALWILIFIVVVQQFDGYILGPKVLGESIGIKPLGVIFAILIGGGLFGVLGMFFGVPVFAVISRTIDGFLDKRTAYKSEKAAALAKEEKNNEKP